MGCHTVRSKLNKSGDSTVRSKLNKFEHVQGAGPCTVRSKFNKFEYFGGGREAGVLYRGRGRPCTGIPLPGGQNDFLTDRHNYKHYKH